MIAFFRAYVFHNFSLKVVSLLVAILLWMAVARDPAAEVSVTVPVEFQHVPDNLEISTEHIAEVQVRVRGPGRDVRNLTPGEVQLMLDLSGAKPGERTYDLKPPLIRVPRELEVVQAVPAQLRLTIDRRAVKQVPIHPRIIGLYAAGRQATVAAVPPIATIIGPEKRVQSIDGALTDAVDAAGMVGAASFPGIHVYVSDPLVQVARPASVTVTVTPEDESGRPLRAGPASTHPYVRK